MSHAYDPLRPPQVPPRKPLDTVEPQDPATFPEVKMDFPVAPGPVTADWGSIAAAVSSTPNWFRTAKFGVFIHWGPQALGKSGDWYARKMYQVEQPAYANHLRDFGHPSVSGYKDVLNRWTAPRFDAARLTRAFSDAGMRFMMVQAVHHDNFDLWNSRHQPWNSVNIGPRRDLLGEWTTEARARGMKTIVAFHHEYTWWWWARAHRSDPTGDLQGVPYDGGETAADGRGKWWDGLDPALLYGPDLGEYRDVENIPFTRQGIFQNHLEYAHWYAERWARRIQDVFDQYDPDGFYTDGNGPETFSGIRSGSGYRCDAARRVVADMYNRSLATHGRVEKMAFIKWQRGTRGIGMTAELGVPEIDRTQPWIGENPIGDWYYAPGYDYRPVSVIRSLLEYASRDGNYACAIPITPEGDLDQACFEMLEEVGRWMGRNGEGIYGSSAWHVWGEGPERIHPQSPDDPTPSAPARILVQAGRLGAATAELPFTSRDFRFTVGAEGALYAWCLTVPKAGESIVITSCRPGHLLQTEVQRVTILGVGEVPFRVDAEGLHFKAPDGTALNYVMGIRIDCKIPIDPKH